MIIAVNTFFFTLSTTSFHFAILASSRNGWTGGAIGFAERGFWISHRHTPRFRDGNVSAPHARRIPRALSRWEGFARGGQCRVRKRMEKVEGYELEEGTHFLPVATYHNIFEICSLARGYFSTLLRLDGRFNKLNSGFLGIEVCEWEKRWTFSVNQKQNVCLCLWLQRWINNGSE